MPSLRAAPWEKEDGGEGLAGCSLQQMGFPLALGSPPAGFGVSAVHTCSPGCGGWKTRGGLGNGDRKREAATLERSLQQ